MAVPVNEDTIRTRVFNSAKSNWRFVLHIASWALAILVTTSVAIGRKQMDSATLTNTVTSLVTEVREMRGEVVTLTQNQAVMSTKLDGVREDVRDFKDWKEKVTGVAETVNVPKLRGHRAHKP